MLNFLFHQSITYFDDAKSIQFVHVQYSRQTRMNQKQLLAKIYGSAFPMRLAMDEMILKSVERPHALGVKSSKLGLEILCNLDDDIDFADYLNATDNIESHNSNINTISIHDQLEARQGLKQSRHI